ncbi:MAG: hypothetical protein U0325_26060 [Polyangiales bacterium]
MILEIVGSPHLEDYLRLLQSALTADEAVWHFAIGQRTLGEIRLPGWKDLARGAQALRDGAAERLRAARAAVPQAAASAVGVVAGVGAAVIVDGVFGPLGLEVFDGQGGGPANAPTQWYPDRYVMALTSRRLVIAEVQRGLAESGGMRLRQRLRLGECAQWSSAGISSARLAFAREVRGNEVRWRVTAGEEPAPRTLAFRATELAPRSVTEVEAIAQRVASSRA